MILDLLREDSGDVDLLALLCEARLHQNKLEEAEETIDSAIALSPDYDYLFYTKARISLEKERYDEAESLLQHAIALDPLDANYFAFLAHIKSFRKEYAEALRLANKALELDSENLLALNTRSTAQLKLGNNEASFETIRGALREDPNNAYTHANYGWGLLEKGEVKKAMEHFKEALQNEPDQTYAQAGLQEALKARNPLYRLFLKYSFFF
jgi:tetratricopeptide (TPR) repeat protein